MFKKGDLVKWLDLGGKLWYGTVASVEPNSDLVEVMVSSMKKTFNLVASDLVLVAEENNAPTSEKTHDNIRHPKHYTAKSDGLETIQIVDHMVEGLKPKAAVRVGNATKYIDRHQFKNGKEDIEKAIEYLQDYVDHYEEFNK